MKLFFVFAIIALIMPLEARRPPRNYGQILPAEKPRFPIFGGEDGEAESLTANAFNWQTKVNSNDDDDDIASESTWKQKNSKRKNRKNKNKKQKRKFVQSIDDDN